MLTESQLAPCDIQRELHVLSDKIMLHVKSSGSPTNLSPEKNLVSELLAHPCRVDSQIIWWP